MNRLLTSLTALMLTVIAATAATDSIATEPLRPVTAAYTIGIGNARVTDTYLTPLKYKGWSTELRYERWQAAKFDPERWTMQLNGALAIDRSVNPAGNASMWRLALDVTWGLAYRWRLPYSITVGAGALIDVDAGCIYNKRNSNNPASAKGAVTIDATGYITWSTRLGSTPVTLRYQPTIPLTGAFFSPDYDELYYEIYLGNRSGLVHGAWWGNYFKMTNLVTVDFRVSNTAVRIGYRSSVLSAKVSNIVTNISSNQFVVGLSGEWISLSPKRRLSPEARIISAYY